MLLLLIANAVYGTPTTFEKSTKVEELPSEANLSDFIKYLRLRELVGQLDDEESELDNLEKRARFHPRLGKRSFNFRARLGKSFVTDSCQSILWIFRVSIPSSDS